MYSIVYIYLNSRNINQMSVHILWSYMFKSIFFKLHIKSYYIIRVKNLFCILQFCSLL